jgi:L-asparaginase / beta-aspartyl-peptidase
MNDYVLVVHGGAGTAAAAHREAAEGRRVEGGLRRALAAGRDVLSAGGRALDAVELAVSALEDDPRFNAGRGSVLTRAGTVEMDAAIMCGERRAAGAVAGVTGVVHPVSAARAVMERTRHVLLTGASADALAAAAGLAVADPSYFVTAARRRQWQRDRDAVDPAEPGGTVGAVALDRHGHLAAATSTGGMLGQLPGRVGDSPIVGAGTWAADGRCAVSATGDGELIARVALAHEIDARLRLAGESIGEAAAAALALVSELGGGAGCIAIDGAGAVAMPFNTASMARGVARGDGTLLTAIGPGPLG